MAVNSSEKGQDAYSIVVLPDEGTTVRQCGSHLSFLSFLEIPKGLKHSLSLDTILNSQEMENADAYCPCIADVDIEKGKSETPKINDAPVGKNEDTLARTLLRHINIQMGGNFLQLLMDHSIVLLKFNFRDKSGPEKVHDTLNSRPRKYKRSASFNSRKVVLLFSLLQVLQELVDGMRNSYLYSDLRSKDIYKYTKNFSVFHVLVKYGNTDFDLFDLKS